MNAPERRHCAACGSPYLERTRLFHHAQGAHGDFTATEYRYPCVCSGGPSMIDDGLGPWIEADVAAFVAGSNAALTCECCTCEEGRLTA